MSYLEVEGGLVWYPECGLGSELGEVDGDGYVLPFDPDGRWL